MEVVGSNVVQLDAHMQMQILAKESLLVLEAQKWLFVREHGGANLGQCVEEFQNRFGRGFRGASWCSIFTWYCVEEAQEQYDTCMMMSSPQPQAFRSASTQECFKRSKDELRLLPDSDQIRPGTLVVWEHLDAAGKPTGRGHIGIVEKLLQDGKFQTIEGNTGSGEGVVREGDGVYRRVRSRGQVGSMRLLGFVKVWG